MPKAVLVRLRPTGPWRIGPDSGDRDRVDRIYHSDALYAAVCGAMFRLGEGEAPDPRNGVVLRLHLAGQEFGFEEGGPGAQLLHSGVCRAHVTARGHRANLPRGLSPRRRRERAYAQVVRSLSAMLLAPYAREPGSDVLPAIIEPWVERIAAGTASPLEAAQALAKEARS
jgi:hypothetical protein